MKTLYARIADDAHDTIAEIAAIAGLSMAATIEAMVNVQAGLHHIYGQQYKDARDEFVGRQTGGNKR